MTPSVPLDAPIALGHAEQSYVNRFQWMVPVLIGLSAPLVFALLVVPTVIDDARPLVSMILAALVFIGAGAASIAMILRGDAVGMVINKDQRTVEVYLENMFATHVTSLEMSDIASFEACERRDRDGFSYKGATLMTKSGKIFEILASLTSDEIAAGRAAMGLR